MHNFLHDFLPEINLLGSCTGNLKGPCISPFASISRLSVPLTDIRDKIVPRALSKSTIKECSSFHDFFFISSSNKEIDNGEFNKKTIRYALDANQSKLICDMIDEMDNLVASGYDVLKCLLDMLCICRPTITLYGAQEQPALPGFAYTSFSDPVKPSPYYLDMGFYFTKINNDSYVFKNEYIFEKFWKGPNHINLTQQNSSVGYFTSHNHNKIGILVHELGHVLDALFWGSHFAAKSHVHSFMWESFYFQEFWLKNAVNFKPFNSPLDFLNLPYPVECDDITNKLSKYSPSHPL